jgi:hypothetical protein
VNAGPLPNGVRVGQVGVNTLDNKFSIWTGSQWAAVKAPGSVNTVEGDLVGISQISVSVAGDVITLDAQLADTSSPSELVIGPTSGGGPVSYRQLIDVDLPTATSVSQGAVLVSGDGLGLDGNRIVIDNTVTPLPENIFGVVTHTSNGLVTESRKITGADLPPATASEIGAVRAGDGLALSPEGTLSIDNGVTAGVAAKVAFSDKGLITEALPLEPTDLPEIPGNKITGTILGSLLSDRSVGEIKLADYSTCLMQEGQPSGDYKLGQMWFTPSTSQLRVYGRGSGSQDLWYSVGFGALQSQNLRWAGTINASTSTIVTLTDIGVSEGLTAGGPIPTPTDELSGVYFVVQEPGSGIALLDVSGETFTEGDWLLCLDQAQGYTHINISAGGGGGGGGASKLEDLTDVNLTNPEADQFLQYDAISGMWINAADVDGGTF